VLITFDEPRRHDMTTLKEVAGRYAGVAAASIAAKFDP
jgi:hypothetical protein